MRADETPLSDRARALREAFDRSFAEAPRLEQGAPEDIIAVRVAGSPYAIRLAEISGLFADRPITPVPGPVPELLGLAGLRGLTVPVYDLGALLGLARADKPRWLVLARGSAPLGLAFERLERHLRLPREAIAPATPPRSAVREVARSEDGALPVMHLPSILEAIRKRVPQGSQ
jgi:purine-binding chemotaxis protein CheW